MANSSSTSNAKITIATAPSSLIVDEETAVTRSKELEEMFSNRYSEEDADFVATKSKPVAPPPCVQNFYSRPKRAHYDRSRHSNRSGYQGNRGQRDDNRGERRHEGKNEQSSRYHPYGNRQAHHNDNPYRIRHDDRY